MWMRWNDTTHIFEQSTNDGASWAILPLNASILTEGSVNSARLPPPVLPATVAYTNVNNNFSVGQTITGGLGIVTGGLNITTGGLTVTGPINITGLITQAGNGMSLFSGSVAANSCGIGIRNTDPTGTGSFWIGNDLGNTTTNIIAFGSTFVGGGYATSNSSSLVGNAPNGLALVASAGPLRFFAGSAGTERMRIDAAGVVIVGATAGPFSPRFLVLSSLATTNMAVWQNTDGANSGNFALFVNSAGAIAGNIAHSGVTSIIIGTTSDARLKTDLGQIKKARSLRELIIHDFKWKADDSLDHGIFAQEAYEFYPNAIIKGNEELNEEGNFTHPWMIDYSKLVPDLIAGWQEHDREITELKALIEKMLNDKRPS